MSNGNNFQMTDEVKMLIERLPRSVIDVFGDKISIHAVDMVQAQMDREKEFKLLQEENMAMRVEIQRLREKAGESEPEPQVEPIPEEEPTSDVEEI